MGARSDTTYPGNRTFVDRDGTMHAEGITFDVVVHTVDATLTEDDSGKIHVAGAVDLVFTLPATQAGLVFQFVVSTVSATTGASISPAAADQIIGNGFTAADDKDAINTAATDAAGDAMTVVGNGTTGWLITNTVGTWAREA